MGPKDMGVVLIENINILINIDLSTLIICKNDPCIINAINIIDPIYFIFLKCHF